MLKPEEKAISLFNQALKTCICLNLDPNKKNAQEIVLFNLLIVKEFFYDATMLDNLGAQDLKKSHEHINRIKTTIENL